MCIRSVICHYVNVGCISMKMNETENREPKTELRVLDDCRETYMLVRNYIGEYVGNDYTDNILKAQIIRATISIGSNIAEGNKRKGKDYNRFLTISEGSIAELEFQLSLINEQRDQILDLLVFLYIKAFITFSWLP